MSICVMDVHFHRINYTDDSIRDDSSFLDIFSIMFRWRSNSL